MYHENGLREAQDENGRGHASHGGTLQQSQYPHRHTSMHQSLQGIPHHHHVVHHRYHASTSRSGGNQSRSHDMDRHLSGPEHDRYAPPPEQTNHAPKSSSSNAFRSKDEVDGRDWERHRDQTRGSMAPLASGPPPTGQSGQVDRQQPYTMTPSQVVQGGFTPRPIESSTSRREHWPDEIPHGRGRFEQDYSYGSSSLPPLDGPARHGQPHSRQISNGIASPHPRNGVPQSPPPLPAGPGVAPSYPNHLQSPSRLPLSSAHASPRANASTPKGPGTRPISPNPVTKHLPQSASSFTGPGTPGGGASRLGTPGLSGPGTRPDGPPNGHALGISHGPGLYPSGGALSGPAQPMLPPDPHMAPPKLTAVQLGNGA